MTPFGWLALLAIITGLVLGAIAWAFSPLEEPPTDDGEHFI